MEVYIVKFPGVWFQGSAVVVAPNAESAIFLVKNHLDFLGDWEYRGKGQALKDTDFTAEVVDRFDRGIKLFESGNG